MKALKTARLLESIERFGKRDPELHAELSRKIGEPAKKKELPTGPGMAEAYEKVPFLSAEVRAFAESTPEPAPAERPDVTAYEQRVAETIVRPSARPVLVIRDNKVTTDFLGPDSQVWASRISGARSVLDLVIPSVGRVEVKNNPDYNWLGTGWLIADDVVVTNRHVAREFGRSGPSGFVFRAGASGGVQAAAIDFLEEYQRTASLEYTVDSILWIAPPGEPDVAFLRLKRPAGTRALPKPIRLSESTQCDEFVATIGYPARDPRVPDQELVKRIFGDVYEKKRLAPGQITDVTADELQHDCSTLGGNSGSPVVNLKTGEAVGLHFSGLFLEANYAVPGTRLRDLFTRLQRWNLPGMGPVDVSSRVGKPSMGASGGEIAEAGAPGTFSLRLQIPVEITVRVGDAVSTQNIVVAGAAVPTRPLDYAAALRAAQEALSQRNYSGGF